MPDNLFTPEAVFFDMDGTLIDSEPAWHAAEIELMAEFDYAWGMEDIQFCIGGPLSKVGLYMHEKSKRLNTPQFFVEELISRTSELLKKNFPFMPGAKELLDAYLEMGIPVGIVSASPRSLVDNAVFALPEGSFAVSISSDDVSRTKPFADPYLAAASKIDVNIENCIILEDSQTGIDSARAAGGWVVAIPHFITPTFAPRTIVLETLLQVTPQDIHNKIDELRRTL